MRFLADENVPSIAIAALAAAGHDITSVRRATPGASDGDVLARAAREGRVLLTFDKDFGELAGGVSLPPSSGIVLLRVPAPNTEGRARRLSRVIASRGDWAGHFSVIEPGRIRMRPLR
jgi:predicted nuclease of predicted toxin-antitoxin system